MVRIRALIQAACTANEPVVLSAATSDPRQLRHCRIHFPLADLDRQLPAFQADVDHGSQPSHQDVVIAPWPVFSAEHALSAVEAPYFIAEDVLSSG